MKIEAENHTRIAEQEKVDTLSKLDEMKQEKIKILAENDKVKQEKINSLNERDKIIEERNQLQIDNERAIAERDRLRIENNRIIEQSNLIQSDNERVQTERNRIIEERNQQQRDNQIALADINRERIEKEKAYSERDQEKNRANIAEQEKQKELQEKQKALSEIDKLKQKVKITEQEKQKEIQEKQKAQSERDQEKRRADTEHAEVIRLTAEITRLNQSLLSVPSSINIISYQSIIPNPVHMKQQENKIIRTNKGDRSTVAFNPVITSGIVRFGGFFKDHPSSYNFIIGIADSSAVFGSNEGSAKGENIRKTVSYYKDGDLTHIEGIIKGNSRIEENKTVAMEVNMNIRPLPSSINIISYQSIIPNPVHMKQQENKRIRTNKGDRSTVAFNPVITSGIVRFGGFFKDHPSSYNFSMSI
ncbi:MAG: hypothetical protein EZS28_036387 [Streblomastix strix]|uniref:Uncharacterized protein n=1 Tax=Streblomastix strix TaxID=222440 RepID=A0A5J4UBA2_9EUKA|nr:MAG: hypothetical protein EZS28_036387 [Streblomastix strix]